MSTDRTLSATQATAWSIPISAALAALVLVPYHLLWGGNPLKVAKDVHWLVLLAVFVASVIAHEAIHAIAWSLASDKPRPRFKFGVNWGALMPYAHAIDPMHAKAYRIGAAAPGLVLGVLPAAIGLATGSAALSVWGTAMLLVAGGDFLVIATLRGVPPMTPVKDHPVRVGCDIVETGAPRPSQ